MNADRALALSPAIRAIVPSINGRLNLTSTIGPNEDEFSPNAVSAFFAAVESRSAKAQRSQLSAILDTAVGFLSRTESITSCNGRVSAFESSSTNACSDLITGSLGAKANMRSYVDFCSA